MCIYIYIHIMCILYIYVCVCVYVYIFRCSNFETNKSLCFTSKAPDCLLQPWVLVHLPSTRA